MTPHQRKRQGRPVGSLILAWQRQPVGRIYRGTGLPDTREGHRRLRQVEAACDALFQAGRLDVLRALKNRQLHPIQLLEAIRFDRLGQLPTAAHLADLAPAMTRWAEQTPTPFLRANRTRIAAILSAYPNASIGDLPELVTRVQGDMAATPSQANRVKDQAQAFLRDTLGRGSDLYRAVAAIERLAAAPKYRRAHLTPDQFRALLPTLGPAAETVRLLCLTGANPKEAWEDGYDLLPHGVAIHGKKARGRERVIPRLADDLPATPTCSRDVIIWWLNKAGLVPYDCRRTFARWLADVGTIPEWRQRAYLGHAAGSQTRHYQMGDVTPYLLGDARDLRAYLGLPPVPAKTGEDRMSGPTRTPHEEALHEDRRRDLLRAEWRYWEERDRRRFRMIAGNGFDPLTATAYPYAEDER